MTYDTQASGNYSVDCAKGRFIANAVLLDMRATGNPTLLGHAISRITADNQGEGVRIGFAHRLAEHLIG